MLLYILKFLNYHLKSIIEKTDLCFDIGYGDKDTYIETVLNMLDIPTFAFSDTQYSEKGNNYYVFESMGDLINQVNKLPANNSRKTFDDVLIFQSNQLMKL